MASNSKEPVRTVTGVAYHEYYVDDERYIAQSADGALAKINVDRAKTTLAAGVPNDTANKLHKALGLVVS